MKGCFMAKAKALSTELKLKVLNKEREVIVKRLANIKAESERRVARQTKRLADVDAKIAALGPAIEPPPPLPPPDPVPA
jgi:hypothetical protein